MTQCLTLHAHVPACCEVRLGAGSRVSSLSNMEVAEEMRGGVPSQGRRFVRLKGRPQMEPTWNVSLSASAAPSESSEGSDFEGINQLALLSILFLAYILPLLRHIILVLDRATTGLQLFFPAPTVAFPTFSSSACKRSLHILGHVW